MLMPNSADLLITNAAVYTVDETTPRAEAVAVRGNRIVFVGSAAEANEWRSAQTKVFDGAGCTLLPGLIDSHFHLQWGSLKLDDLQLWNAETMADVAALIRAYAAANPQRDWLIGAQLRYKVITPEQPLTRQFLDSLVADRPLYLVAYDGHTAWANTEALRRAGILHGRELPPGHAIVMEPTGGTATGELREWEALRPIKDLLPEKTAAQKQTLLRQGLALCAQHGITSVHNMDSWDDSLANYLALEAANKLTVRLYVPYSFTPELPLTALQEAANWKRQYQGPYVRAGAVKFFMDGVIESGTALMVDDYAGQPGNRGGSLYTAAQFNELARTADQLGLQMTVHCCGDGAVKRTLDGYEYALRENGRRDSRHRIEHIEVIDAPDIARFAKLGVIASMQPLHAPPVPSSDVWAEQVGPERWLRSFAWRTLREAGAHLIFGSDWPVVTLDPMLGFAAALNRQPWTPDQPVQRQTLAETIQSYTRDAAYVEFQAHEKGMIRVGMLADLVLFSADLFALPPEQITTAKPVLTVCNGQVVYEAT